MREQHFYFPFVFSLLSRESVSSFFSLPHPVPLSLALSTSCCRLACLHFFGTQSYPNISLSCRQEMRDPFFLEPFRKSSRVIMAHYLMVRVYLGFHCSHCPLETRENISPTATRVLFTSDHKCSEAARFHRELEVGKTVLWCPAQQFT